MRNTLALCAAAIFSSLPLLAQNTPPGGTAPPPATQGGAAIPPRILIDASAPRISTSPDLYGIFYEEISHAGEGGLYAELVQNRDLEATTLPDNWRTEGPNLFSPGGSRTPLWFRDPTPAWTPVNEGGADAAISLEIDHPLNANNPHSLKLTSSKNGSRAGIANSGFWGMNIQQAESYNLSFYARTDANRSTSLTISLESDDGKTISAHASLSSVGGPWKKYSLPLTATATNPKARLVLSQSTPGTIWFDTVSLFPAKTFKNHGMRPQLCQMLADLHPAFLRFPGGCVVEGASLNTRWNWKGSIGDISQRKGLFDLWGYYNTNGLGFHEYLQLAEDLNAQPMYVINVGITCSARRPVETAQGDDLKPYLQDTLDALEYAMGPATSQWGSKRAANGHPAPFKIKFIEIGNENGGPIYHQNYQLYYDAIKAKYPQILTIANQRIPNGPMEFIDEHFYRNPEQFFAMSDKYDSYDRKGPRIYVGEYAVNRNVAQGNLYGALSEAVFMLNMEKNSDLVSMCSYAPLFENVNKRDWPVNLIRFDSTCAVGRTSYQVQKLFGENKPDQILKTDITSDATTINNTPIHHLYALAGIDTAQHQFILKVVNPTPWPQTTAISIKGLPTLAKTAKVITLAHPESTAENTLDSMSTVLPTEKSTPLAPPDFNYEFPPNSLTILRIPT